MAVSVSQCLGELMQADNRCRLRRTCEGFRQDRSRLAAFSHCADDVDLAVEGPADKNLGNAGQLVTGFRLGVA